MRLGRYVLLGVFYLGRRERVATLCEKLANPMIPVRGVRSSWLTDAISWSLDRTSACFPSISWVDCDTASIRVIAELNWAAIASNIPWSAVEISVPAPVRGARPTCYAPLRR